eukprot:16449172-Heterocapsa_arctica.AAC.2
MGQSTSEEIRCYQGKNNEADIQAKSGAAKHGYTESQKNAIKEKVVLAKHVQEHMLRNNIIYIQHTLVREDALKRKISKAHPQERKADKSSGQNKWHTKCRSVEIMSIVLDVDETPKQNTVSRQKEFSGGENTSCLAKGPALNKRNCINPTYKHVVDDEDDDRHRHKTRRTELEAEKEKNDGRNHGADLGIMTGVQRDNSEDRANAADTGFLINKQARKRAEEKQAEVNDSKRRKHIEAHQKK